MDAAGANALRAFNSFASPLSGIVGTPVYNILLVGELVVCAIFHSPINEVFTSSSSSSSHVYSCSKPPPPPPLLLLLLLWHSDARY